MALITSPVARLPSGVRLHMEYKLVRANLVADDLSRKGELANISQPQSNLRECIKKGLQHDTLAQSIFYYVNEGKTRRFWEEDSLILTNNKCIYAPSYDNFRWKS